MDTLEGNKKIAGEKAADFVQDGMIIGLGTGSTVYWTIKKIAERIKGGLRVKGIPSSSNTERWAIEFGIPLTDFSEVQNLDLTIDGADEIDPNFNLIKGGGGALLREKIVSISSKELIIVADDSKIVSQLGNFPLPVEVVPFGWEITAQKIAQLGCSPALRMKDDRIFSTDNGNYILDCTFESIPDPEMTHNHLKLIVGVVETGLFIGMADKVIIGESNEVTILKKK
ncbi:ribose-5-phosphate isomerase RpiA [Bacillus sp. CECT 9360]|uniref:ribose-5-phosphate isomerase RpiA n=1 Tax=Bacillus sp. CECT 9360 TaxID=2845821 RepID=UPI001E3592A3|nr:ribose-5-phosphate isomerase RpiA [Bacillus sp. CECT 9360]CAH0347099.1 Ribose-5-phosphate isomerase A [Bacillus sp. CECT 9360]